MKGDLFSAWFFVWKMEPQMAVKRKKAHEEIWHTTSEANLCWEEPWSLGPCETAETPRAEIMTSCKKNGAWLLDCLFDFHWKFLKFPSLPPETNVNDGKEMVSRSFEAASLGTPPTKQLPGRWDASWVELWWMDGWDSTLERCLSLEFHQDYAVHDVQDLKTQWL